MKPFRRGGCKKKAAEPPRLAGIFPTGQLNWKDGMPERRPLLVAGAPKHLRPGLAASLKGWSVFFDPDPVSANGSGDQEGRLYDALEGMDGLAVALWQGAAREPLGSFIDRQACPLYLIQEGMLRGTARPGEVRSPLSYVFLPLDRGGAATADPLDQAYAGLLNTVDFEAETLEDSASLMKVMGALKISRDNPSPRVASCRQDYLHNYAGRHRVLVAGEARPDPEDSTRLIAEAHKLYPESEIVYLPHRPEAPGAAPRLTGSGEITVIRDYGQAAWLLEDVDCVFVYSSSLGLEGLWHGCEVHVFGPAFYAGWGLTIDHAPQPNRRRTLTKEQLFYGIYLSGHQYRLGGGGDPVRTMLAAMFEISHTRSSAFDAELTPGHIVDALPDLAQSPYSPVLLRKTTREAYRKKYKKESFKGLLASILLFLETHNSPAWLRTITRGVSGKKSKFIKELLSSTIFSLSGGAVYQETAACCILGLFPPESPEYVNFFTALQSRLSLESYSRICSSLAPMETPARVHERQYAIHKARWEIGRAIALKRRNLFGSGGAADVQTRPDQTAGPAPGDEPGSLNGARPDVIFDLAGLELERRNLEAALKLYYLLLARGESPQKIVPSIMEIARLRFDFRSLPALGHLLYYLYEPSQSPKASLSRVKDLLYQGGVCDEAEALKALIQCCARGGVRPLTNEGWIVDILSERFGELPYALALYDVATVTHPDGVLDTCSDLIALGRVEDAARRLGGYTPVRKEQARYSILLARACGLRGQYGRAKKILAEARRRFPAHEGLGDEMAWILANTHDLAGGDEWMRLFHRYNHKPLTMGFFRLAAMLGKVAEARAPWQNLNLALNKSVRRCFPEKLVTSFDQAVQKKARSALVYKHLGPGDELFAVPFYRAVKQALADSGIEAAFTCDHRFYRLLSRSYPDLKFIPSHGVRRIHQIKDFSLFDKLPASDLCEHFSNVTYEAIQEYDVLILHYNAMHDTREVSRNGLDGQLSFYKKPYLTPDPELVRHWHDRLRPLRREEKPLVGIAWRSPMQGFRRNEHYLSVQEISGLLETDEIDFINIQVGDIRRELAWLERRLSRPLIHFPDLDQFNDFENTAAMFEYLDFIVSPWTTSSVLAGGLGTPVLCFSPTHSDKCYAAPETYESLYYPSTTHIFPDAPNDRESLQKNLKQALLAAARSDGWKQRRAAVAARCSVAM